MNGINVIKKVGDTTFLSAEGREFGIQDVSSRFASAIKESKLLTRDQKLKEFINIIPSFEVFKNLAIEKERLIKTEIFDVYMKDITKNTDECFYLLRIAVEPKYWNAGIGSIIYSYVERIIKEMGYKCILIGANGTMQIINFYKRQGFFPIDELDAKYIVPLLEQLNTENLAVTDETGDRYIMPMQKNI